MEFNGEWENLRIKNILSIQHGKDYSHLKSGNIPVLGTGGIITYVNDFLCDWECVLIGRKGTITKPQFMSVPFWSVDTLFYSKPQINHCPKFQYYLFETIKWEKHNEGSGVPSLSASTIESLKVNIPQFNEQNKIANFLSKIDTRITTQSKIIEVLKSQKKWIYDIVFNKIDAEIVPLGNLCNIKKGEQINGSELNDNDIYPFMNGGTSPSGYFHMFNANENTISISEGGNSCGYIQFNKNKFWCGGHCYSLINIKEQVNNKYLYHFLKANELNIMRLRVGSGLPNIQKKDLENFSIFIPSLKEQNFIANFLDICDLKINLEEVLLIKLKEQKKYLLSNMFI